MHRGHNGLDEAFRSIRYGRQTRQVQQRIGHEDQIGLAAAAMRKPTVRGMRTMHQTRVDLTWSEVVTALVVAGIIAWLCLR